MAFTEYTPKETTNRWGKTIISNTSRKKISKWLESKLLKLTTNLGYSDECDQIQAIACDSATGLFKETIYLPIPHIPLEILTINYSYVCSRSIQTPR